jgi:hypothetical protein
MTVTIWQGGQAVATHERCYRRRQQVLELEHYLDVLIHKPGALAGSTPLAQWRATGRWTAAHDQLWACLRERRGAQEGTRQLIELLQLGRQQGYEQLTRAIEQALTCGAYDAAAVRWLLTAPPLAPPAVPSLAPTDLTPSDYVTRPLPSLDGYDQLLAPAAAAIQETGS